MIRKSVDITGEGPHTIVVASPQDMIITYKMVLTFSHAGAQALPVTFMGNDRIVAGPFFVLDGGDITYLADEGQRMDIKRGDSLVFKLASGLSCAGLVDYDMGQA